MRLRDSIREINTLALAVLAGVLDPRNNQTPQALLPHTHSLNPPPAPLIHQEDTEEAGGVPLHQTTLGPEVALRLEWWTVIDSRRRKGWIQPRADVKDRRWQDLRRDQACSDQPMATSARSSFSHPRPMRECHPVPHSYLHCWLVQTQLPVRKSLFIYPDPHPPSQPQRGDRTI